MEYKKGSIVMQSRLRFKDGSYDPHIQRPTMIAIGTDAITNETYYLTITSQIQYYISYSEKYYLIDGSLATEIGLKRASLINLEAVYKGVVNGETKCGMPPRMYKDVMTKLKRYKEKYPDKVFDEIKGKLRT